MTQTHALLLNVVAWLVWAALVIAVIKVDQRRRRRIEESHTGDDRYDDGIASFEDKSVTPYLLIGIFCGALALPAYFYATRRTVVGALQGVVLGGALTLAIYLLVSGIGGPIQRAERRAWAERDVEACLQQDPFLCQNAALPYSTGLGVEKDVAKAAALLSHGCQGGDLLACVRLIDLPPGDNLPPAILDAARAEGAKLCKTLPGGPKPREGCGRFGR